MNRSHRISDIGLIKAPNRKEIFMVSGIQGGMNMSTDMMAQRKESMFTKLDPDGDGQIDLSQIQSTAEGKGGQFSKMLENLTAADTDGNGQISKAEFSAIQPPGRGGGGGSGMMRGAGESQPNILDYLYTNDGNRADTQDLIGDFLDEIA